MSSPNFLEEGLLLDNLVDQLREYFQISIGLIIASFAIHNFVMGGSMKITITSGILATVVFFFGTYIFTYIEIVTNYLNENNLYFNELKLSEILIIGLVLLFYGIIFSSVVLYIIAIWIDMRKRQTEPDLTQTALEVNKTE
jgi:type IV secretory pathway TrbD component